MGHDFEWDEVHTDSSISATTSGSQIPDVLMRGSTSVHEHGPGNEVDADSGAGQVQADLERMAIDNAYTT